MDISKCEKELTAMMNNLDNSEYYQIVGEYPLWQEIFSHMSGEYLLTTSLSRMSVQSIIDLMRIAVLYDMKKLLTQYVKALQQRMNIQTVFTVSHYSSCIHYYSLILYLYMHCRSCKILSIRVKK
jgi:hypothetical protein